MSRPVEVIRLEVCLLASRSGKPSLSGLGGMLVKSGPFRLLRRGAPDHQRASRNLRKQRYVPTPNRRFTAGVAGALTGRTCKSPSMLALCCCCFTWPAGADNCHYRSLCLLPNLMGILSGISISETDLAA